VAAPLADALAPFLADPSRAAILLDVDGVLAPIVRHADDAHVPEPTRAPLIKVAKGYGFVACVSGRQAAVARRIVSIGSITYVGNHGTEVLRGGATEVEIDPEIAAWAERVAAFADATWSEELDMLRVRAEDKQAIRAFHWRGAPDEEAAEQAVRSAGRPRRARGLRDPLGAQGARGPPARADGQGPRDRAPHGGRRDGLRPLRGRRRDRHRRVPRLRDLVAAGDLGSALCVGVRSDETPPALEEAADVLVDGPIGVRRLLTTLAG
jgi:trehalose 6-phosphate phosphatase